MKCEIINFQDHTNKQGSLFCAEFGKEVPFIIKRVYYIYAKDGQTRRGFHAHKKLKQLLFCPTGSCKIHLDDGKDTKEVLLNEPNQSLLIESNIWREMYDFSPNCVLMVLASELYDEKDYIRDYDEFLKFIKRK